ncbi:MAG: polynucleotide adenylyltransferase PcnB [Treponema sp.]|jgi:poly(A) polymerase|nr:polynucleotide adenylyltransferase PcnB [Treponema sp.]
MRYRYSTGKNGKPVKKAIIYTCDEHGINFSDINKEAVGIIKKLRHAGFDAYIVGGAVRDLILGKKPKDFDIVSNASPAKIKKVFRNSRIIGRRFRLVHVYFEERVFEVSTFRSLKDGYTGNIFGTMDEDVFRRDFTMNALFYDIEQQVVIDYVGGMNDIKKKQVKPVIPLSEIFTEDPVRMIRAVKYAALAGFSIPFNLKLKISRQSELLAGISPSRLTEEILKIINSDNAAAVVNLLDKMGLYNYLQPNAASLMRKNPSFRQNYLKNMAALNGSESGRGQVLGALFYDYLETVYNWEGEYSSGKNLPVSIENFREIFKAVRSFMLPMNPPRYDLERTLRKYFSNHGIIIKRPHIEKLKPTVETVENKPSAARKRRRRKHKPELKESANVTQNAEIHNY